jgi:DNA topoisomerase-1
MRQRIESLVIPPAWTSVWICAHADGHIQATGLDERGRKQYLYHERWSAHRNAAKFAQLREFAAVLPKIRRRVRRDLKRKSATRECMLAAAVRLLDETCIRIGNERYRKANNSYGLTTLKPRHAHTHHGKVTLNFNGKGGQPRKLSVHDPDVAAVLNARKKEATENLFQYVDDAGERRTITSSDINAYLQDVAGKPITAKDFRTWGGTVVAAESLHAEGPSIDRSGQRISERELQRRIRNSVKTAADLLGDTVATARKYYVHPILADAYAEGTLTKEFKRAATS